MTSNILKWCAIQIANNQVPEERVVLTNFCIKLFTRFTKTFNEVEFLDYIHKLRLVSK